MNTRSLFNHNWKFLKETADCTIEALKEERQAFSDVILPHDWLIYNTDNLYEDGTGWYKKKFYMNKEALQDGKPKDAYTLRFDGVYMDSTVYVNGKIMGEWKYGYSMFEVAITDGLVEGENEILVKVVYKSPNTRWYSGAGIYRDVWLIQRSKNYLQSDGIYVCISHDESGWLVDIETELHRTSSCIVTQRLVKNSDIIAENFIEVDSDLLQGPMEVISQQLMVIDPILWSTDDPELYELETELIVENQSVEVIRQKIGFKDVLMDPEKGFSLNGKSMKLNGVCEHHDLGCLGSAFNKEAMRYRLAKLKAMGVNAIRTAHNMPAKDVMDLADEMGILVVSEAFDVWELSKTSYDYARFFGEWAERDVRSWVRRDRNHVSLIMWSIGNEIYDTHAGERGQIVTRNLIEMVEEHDPKKNGAITIGSNYMPWDNARKCADIVKYAGYNYAEKYYEDHHEAHTDWIIYGSETSSIVQSRGIYHFPLEAAILADDDMQCSSLGNSTTSWGARSIETCITQDRDMPFSLGQFLWTGFDYIGEPTPYHTRNSYFGQIDTAGFEKDSYFAYQSGWVDYKNKPMIHIFPHWDYNIGQMIDVKVCSNAPRIELYLNNELIGEKYINHQVDKDIIGTWKVPYENGQLKAIAYDEGDNVIAEDLRHSFGDVCKLTAKVNKKVLKADGKDLVFVEIGGIDQDGYSVDNANLPIYVQVSGQGTLLGLDNGDSTDIMPYKSNVKRLFSGKCLAVVGSTLNPGQIELEIASQGLEPVKLVLESEKNNLVGETLAYKNTATDKVRASSVIDMLEGDEAERLTQNKPVRRIELTRSNEQTISKENMSVAIKAKVHPLKAMVSSLEWRVVNDSGIDSNIGVVEEVEEGYKVFAKGDGKFKVRFLTNNGKDHPEIMSELEFEAKGLGLAYKDPYEFVCGGLYDYSQGLVSNGNERGVATDRDGKTVIGYENIDFGDYGSDTITLPIFTLDDDLYHIEVWEGIPGDKGSIRLDVITYQKPSKWNVYQEETYVLPKKLKGITTLCLATTEKIHIKGFSFDLKTKAYEQLNALECDDLYGDSFEKHSWGIGNIGNNVTLTYHNMDFYGPNDKGVGKITLCAKALTGKNSIRIQAETTSSSFSQIIEFESGEAFETKVFDIKPITGSGKVEFIFLPGSQFDFKWFRFS